MKINVDLKDLVSNSIITEETAQNISKFYLAPKTDTKQSAIYPIAIIASILISVGIILILSYNWDQIGKKSKVLISLMPLLISQGIAFYVLFKRYLSRVWSESVSIAVSLSFYASISLISSIYYIEGDLSIFSFTWSLLVLPLVYIFRSGFANVLFAIGISVYLTSFRVEPETSKIFETTMYWPLLAIAVFNIKYLKGIISTWLFNLNIITLILSMLLSIAPVYEGNNPYSFNAIGFIALFSLIYTLNRQQILKSAFFYYLSLVGLFYFMIPMSTVLYWDENHLGKNLTDYLFNINHYSLFVVPLITIALIIIKKVKFEIFSYFFIIYFLLFALSFFHQYTWAIASALLIAIGVKNIITGYKNVDRWTMNFGLLVICLLAVGKLFDTELSLGFRGTTFVVSGLLFLLFNYLISKKVKK